MMIGPELLGGTALIVVGLVLLFLMLVPFLAACSILLHLKDIKQSLFGIYQLMDPPGSI